MSIRSSEVKQRMAHFAKVCQDTGIKLTHQRMEIFRELAKTVEHPDAEQVYRGVRKRVPTVSLDTVYRTLWMLRDLGLITTLGDARGKTRFDGNVDPHHHFVCLRCGLMRDLCCDEYDQLKPPKSAETFGNPQTTHVEVRGVCLACVKKEKGVKRP